MSQSVSNLPEHVEMQPQRLPKRPAHVSMVGIVLLLILVSSLILSSSVLLVMAAVQGRTTTSPVARVNGTPTQSTVHSIAALTPNATIDSSLTPTATPPIFAPNNVAIPPLQLPLNHYVIYEQQNMLYLTSAMGGTPQVLNTTGYMYNQAVRPLLTLSGQLLYSGDGIWLADLFGDTPTQIATLAPNQVITSMALSSDGTTIAWSTGPASGNGVIDIFAGPLTSPSKVFEQPSANCPCFRIFAFMNGHGKQGDATLLLTNGQQSNEAIQFGLWTFDLTNPLTATPQQILDGSSQQGPLVLMPSGNVLLYSSYEGEVPMPTDGSVPNDLAVLKYPNSLDLTALDGQPLGTNGSQVVLPEQHQLANSAAYHWVTTPAFTADGRTLLYVEFSSQGEAPFDRSSALFVVHISGSGKHVRVSKPQLMATSTAALFELGAWFNSHIITFYGDGALYALDIQSGAVTTIVQTGAYARIIAVVGMGGA